MPVISAADAIALRFPDSRYDTWDNVASLPAAPTAIDDGAVLFDPNPTMPAPGATRVATFSVTPGAPQAAARTMAAAAPVTDQAPVPKQAAAKVEPMKLASVSTRPAPTLAPRGRPGAVLTDGQIASIKARLRLTPDQEDMWPAVEAALRELSYEPKSAEARGRKSNLLYTANIDTSSSEVQRLKSVAFPLIMSFSDEQKQELRVIAHVAGLEKIATQF